MRNLVALFSFRFESLNTLQYTRHRHVHQRRLPLTQITPSSELSPSLSISSRDSFEAIPVNETIHSLSIISINQQYHFFHIYRSFVRSCPVKHIAELADEPTLHLRRQGSVFFLVRPPIRFLARCTSDSLLIFCTKIMRAEK
jgi:hypothetical protein